MEVSSDKSENLNKVSPFAVRVVLVQIAKKVVEAMVAINQKNEKNYTNVQIYLPLSRGNIYNFMLKSLSKLVIR